MGMGSVPSRTSLPLAWGVLCPTGASACCFFPGVRGEAVGWFPPLGGVGLNYCMGVSTAKSGLISGLVTLVLGIALIQGGMMSSDDSDIN